MDAFIHQSVVATLGVDFIPDSFQRLQFFDDDGVNVTPSALLRKVLAI